MRNYLTLAIAIVINGCSGQPAATYTKSAAPNTASPGSKNSKDSNAAPLTNYDVTNTADEQVSAPSGITGALLFCMSQLDALDIMTQNGVTCRMEDSAGKRVEAATLGGKLNYTVIPPPSTSTLNLLTVIDNPDRTYDLTLAVKGSTKEEANFALNASKLKVDLISLTTGKVIASDTHIVKDVTFDKKATSWVELPSLSASRFLDTATGDYWTLDNKKLYTFKEAQAFCAGQAPIRDFIWQVPSLPAIATSRVHGIGTTALGVKKMNISSRVKYWSATIVGVDDPKTPPTADSNLYSVELLNGEVSADSLPVGAFNTVKQPVVCVAVPPEPDHS